MSGTSLRKTGTTDREITATRVFDAPRELVFRMWTDPDHLARWWGPDGFTTTTYRMDMKPGGVWRFVMHGPDGVDYQNRIVYTEVDAPRRIAYKHGGDKECEPVNFEVTVTFDEHESDPKKTVLTMRMLFPTKAARDFTVEKYGAAEGLNRTLGRLDALVVSPDALRSDFVISRIFDAPRDTVWSAWTQREQLMQWFGPKGFVMTSATLDLRAGGVFHYCLRGPDGSDMWGKFAYRDVIAPQRLVWVHSFSDPSGGVTRHPMASDWPMQMLSTVTFAELDTDSQKTLVTIRWSALNASAAEQQVFDSSHDSLRMGWTGTLDQLAAHLANA